MVSRSGLKSLTGHGSGEKNVRWLSGGSFMGRHYSKLAIKFVSKYQEVYNLESRSLHAEQDQVECQPQLHYWASRQWSYNFHFLWPCSVSTAKSKCFCILEGFPGPFTFHLFPLMEFWCFDLSLLLFCWVLRAWVSDPSLLFLSPSSLAFKCQF